MLARKPEDELRPPGMAGPGPDRTHPASLQHLMTAGTLQPVAGADGHDRPAGETRLVR